MTPTSQPPDPLTPGPKAEESPTSSPGLPSTDVIRIRVGVPPAYRSQAGALICVAFFRQLSSVVCTQPEAIRIFEKEFDPELAVAATHGDKLVGLVTLRHGSVAHHTTRARGPRLSTFIKQFGYLGGPVRFALQKMVMSGRPHRRDELLVEAMAVDEAYRGRGIGARLMEAVFDFARASGVRSIRLEVVDTNPGARRFYEKMGFKAVKTRSYRHLLDRLGFSPVTTMIKTLD